MKNSCKGDIEFIFTKYIETYQCGIALKIVDHAACTFSFIASQVEGQFVSSNNYRLRIYSERNAIMIWSIYIISEGIRGMLETTKNVVGDYDNITLTSSDFYMS